MATTQRINSRDVNSTFKALATLLFLTSLTPTALAVDYTWTGGGGNTDWDDELNWDFQGFPDGFDDTATIDINPDPRLTSSQKIGAVTIIGGLGDLFTNGFDLIIRSGTHSGTITINGGVSGAALVINAGASAFEVDTDNLTNNTGGVVDLRGGGLLVNDTLDNNDGGRITGDGVVRINGNTNFVNDGTLQAAGGTLTLERAGGSTAIFDWDGGGLSTSLIEASTNSTLVIDMPTGSDDLNGEIRVGQNGEVQNNFAWDLGGSAVNPGILNLNGGAGTATISGAAWTMAAGTGAALNANTGTGVIESNLTMTNGTTTVAAGATLQFDGTVTANAGTITNNDLIIFNDDATINAAVDFQMPGGDASLTVGAGASVVINDADYNLDGNGSAGNITTIHAGGLLDINHNHVAADDIMNHTINLNGGTLAVTNAADAGTWELHGLSTLNVAGGGISTINGDELNLFSGNINVEANSTLNVLTVGGPNTSTSTDIDIAAGGEVGMGGGAEYGGGTYTGAGTLRNLGSSTVVADTTIDANTFDMDGFGSGSSHTINDGVTLTINSANFDSDGTMDDPITLVGNGSAINVNGPTEWTQATNDITANSSSSGVVAIGGTSRFVLQTTLNVDGNTAINAPFTLDGGTVDIDSGILLNTNSAAGSTILAGGTITGAGLWDGNNFTAVTADTAINVASIDYDGDTWTIFPDVQLTVNVTDPDLNDPSNLIQNSTTLNSGSVSWNTADARTTFTNSNIFMNNTTGTIPVWSGEGIDIGDDLGTLDANLIIGGTGVSRITAPVDFYSDAEVIVNAGAILELTSSVNFNSVNATENATFTGKGTFRTGETTTNFNEATTFNMAGGTVDFDGRDTDHIATINVNAPVEVNAATFDDFGDGSEVLIVDNLNGGNVGTLTVNLDNPNDSWVLSPSGTLNLINETFGTTLLSGSDVILDGTTNVTGFPISSARVEIGGTVNINTAVGGQFRMTGGSLANPNIIDGGTINGPGELAATNTSLHGNGTINAPVRFFGSARLLADDGELTVDATIFDVGTIGTADDDGILNVVNAWNTNVAISVDLNGGELRGGIITNDSATGINGDGLVSARVINNTRIDAENGGTLRVTNTLTDWDGNTDTGQLNALAGNLEIVDSPISFGFDGTVNIANTHELFVNGFDLGFNSGSTIALTGGTLRSNSAQEIEGIVTVNSNPSRFQTDSRFFSTATVTLNDDLRLDGNTRIDVGASFAGGGSLVNEAGSTLTLVDGVVAADLAVLLDNEGTLVLGTSPGQVTATDFQQSATGILEIEMMGTGLNDFDRLNLTGAASLAGTLDLSLLAPYVPTLGNQLNFLSAPAGIAGTFSTVIQPPTMPAGLAFTVNYFPTIAQLEVVAALAGDFDMDGDVDGNDFLIWQRGGSPNPLSSGDLMDWQDNYGMSLPLVAASTAVPEPSTCILFLMGAVTLQLRRKLD